jgi:hypothetical protein
VKGFKKCCVSSAVDGLMVICCGMSGVCVREMKGLTVKMETVTLTGEGTYSVTCCFFKFY